MISRRNVIASLALIAPAFFASVLPMGEARAQDRIPAVASFSILGDLVKNVGGDRVDLTVLVGPDGDAHVYEPNPADAKKVADAKLVFVNGLGFEGWMERLVEASGSKAVVVTASDGVTPIPFAAEGGHASDPHAFQSIPNAKIYVANIRDALAAADPEGKPVYEANAASYLAELDALDAEVRTAINAIPEGQRKIITSHDAFGYFGRAYGFNFLAPQGISTEAEPSAREVARLIRQIRADRVKAIFVENITDQRMIRRIAAETGAVIGGELYSDALSPPDGPAGTYIHMFRHNIKTLSAALSS